MLRRCGLLARSSVRCWARWCWTCLRSAPPTVRFSSSSHGCCAPTSRACRHRTVWPSFLASTRRRWRVSALPRRSVLPLHLPVVGVPVEVVRAVVGVGLARRWDTLPRIATTSGSSSARLSSRPQTRRFRACALGLRRGREVLRPPCPLSILTCASRPFFARERSSSGTLFSATWSCCRACGWSSTLPPWWLHTVLLGWVTWRVVASSHRAAPFRSLPSSAPSGTPFVLGTSCLTSRPWSAASGHGGSARQPRGIRSPRPSAGRPRRGSRR